MRKRLKKKKRSCALCKPHKTGWANRWKAKELAEIKEFEKIKNKFMGWCFVYVVFAKVNIWALDARKSSQEDC